MKDKSFSNPFGMIFDKHFDKNKDGKLDPLESMFRDMQLNEMYIKTEEDLKGKQSHDRYNTTDQSSTYYKADLDENKSKADESEKQNANNNVSAGAQIFVIFVTIIILIGSIALVSAAEVHALIKVSILFTSVAVSIFLLKSVGLYK